MVICVDFDGTCVSHEFPNIGNDIGAQEVLRKLVSNGHQLILFTMRCDHEKDPKFTGCDPNIVNKKGLYLTDAVNWFKKNGIPLYGIQVNPEQHTWTTSPKAYGQLFIDDAALGCPLLIDKAVSKRPFVDWKEVADMLEMMKLI